MTICVEVTTNKIDTILVFTKWIISRQASVRSTFNLPGIHGMRFPQRAMIRYRIF